jgi:CRISPR-associated protein Cmr4
MFKVAKPFFIKTVTSLHAGSRSDLGIVDLPIQREKHTGFPKIEGSSLKGSLREAFENISGQDKEKLIEKLSSEGSINMAKFDEDIKGIMNHDYAVQLIFGYDEDAADKSIKDKFEGDKREFSGCLGFTDARLLLFPVKSMKGVFVYVTCPYVLKRFVDEMKMTNFNISLNLPELLAVGTCVVPDEEHVGVNNHVVLEEYSFSLMSGGVDIAKTLNQLLHMKDLEKKLVILSDDDFKDFVNLSTEVITRTKIDNETGTVEPGALFNEEYLPAESVMYFLTLSGPVFSKEKEAKSFFKGNGKIEEQIVMDFFKNTLPEYIQIGGNATIGKGIVKTIKPGN